MGKQKEKKGLFLWIEFISKLVAIPALLISLFTFFLHSCEIDNLRKLNKQYYDPKLFLMVYNKDNGISTMRIQNIGILPAVEIYVKKNVYYCSQGGKKISYVAYESPGWHLSELLPTDIRDEDIKQLLIQNSTAGNENFQEVIELCVEFHRQSDLKEYSFRKMYFLKGSTLIWSEDGSIKNAPFYSNLFRLVSNYKIPPKLPKIDELGRYKVDSK